MATTSQTPDLSDFPREQIQFATQEAEREADLVGSFLCLIGLAKRSGPPVELPIDFLVNLGVYLRLFGWEKAGITLHQKAGLPTAKEAGRKLVRDLISGIEKTPTLNNGLLEAVFGLLIENFAWTAQQNLQADIQLDFPDEDALVEAMAQFLWSQRNPQSTQQGCTP